MKKVLGLIVLVLACVLAACGNEEPKENNTTTDYAKDVKENPVVTITMDNDKQIQMELYPKVAPNTVANFISLV